MQNNKNNFRFFANFFRKRYNRDMDEQFLDFIARFSNYTCKPLEVVFEDNASKEQMINEILLSPYLKISQEKMNAMSDERIKYLFVLQKSLEDLLKENNFFS